MRMQEIQQLLAHQVRVMQKLEERFSRLLATGQLTQWSAEEVREAIQISAQHKMLAMQAIDDARLDQAVNNIETVLYIMSGFVEGAESGIDSLLLN